MNGRGTNVSDNIRIDMQKCIVCGLCVDACTVDNLRLKLAPCRHACPLHTNCQGYTQLIARGKPDQGLAVIREILPFVGIIGRVCTHPCEEHCERRKVDGQSVAIRGLKRFLADQEGELRLDFTTAPERPHRVAVVGAGPAGMMAAWHLRQRGYGVVVFDAASRPGGMLTWGIPEFRLPYAVVQREFGFLERIGAEIRLGVAIGQDLGFADLMNAYDAVFVATGAPVAKRLHLPGENAEGVHLGLDLLRAARSDSTAPAVDPQVLVIGGGNVAVDAAQTALRLGGRSVRIVCLEQREQMPAFAEEIENALAEGIEIVPGYGPAALRVQEGRIQAVDFQACGQVWDAAGRFAPQLDESCSITYRADTVIIAIGQDADPGFLTGSGVEMDGRWIRVDPVTRQTSVPRLFAGGDAVAGPRSVVEAMADGREAAESIDRLLSGQGLTYGRSAPDWQLTDFVVDHRGASPQARVVVPRNPAGTGRFVELEGPLSAEQARLEAGRCLNCGSPEGYYRSCWYCLPCEVTCPEDALTVEIPYLVR